MRTRLGKYELLDEIGHGGMATVHRARDTHLDRLVAVKVLHPHLRGAAEARSRFAREARSVARLHHPNILEIYDFSGAEAEESFLVMELLSGPTLRSWAEAHGPLLPEVAACFLLEILAALEAAHGKGIVHRDVKPENVLLHEDREVKLTDFGIAQMVDAQSFTATGQLLGSPCHMAPEQIERGEADERSDVFAAGTVLYFLATGCLPFAGKNPHQILKAVVDGRLADPVRLRPEVGPCLRSILMDAMATDPGKRMPTAAAFAERLRRFLADSGVVDPQGTLRQVLANPVGAQRALEAQVVSCLTERGVAAARAGDLPAAQDFFERVLALDEGNETVLAEVAGLGRQRRRRTRLAIASVVGGAAMLGVATVAVETWPQGDRTAQDPLPRSTSAPPPPASAPPRARIDPPVPREASPEPESRRPRGGRELAAALAPGELGRPPPAGPDSAPEDAALGSSARPSRAERPVAPREVLFQFTPLRPRLSIDGGPLRQVDDDFYRSATLSPGRHVFRFESTDSCCQDDEIVRTIPRGDGPYSLAHALPLNPALLLVRAPAHGAVDVLDISGELVREGRTGQALDVPMDDVEGLFRLRVTVPGFDVYTRTVRLRAGETKEHPASLAPTGPAAEGAR